MATYTVDRAKHATLIATVVDTVNFNAEWGSIRVFNRGMVDIYVRLDGTAPTVAGDECYVIPAGTAEDIITGAAISLIKLISSGIPAYSVEV